ncbi:MAG: tetratricopeptide repeat protein [Myxococcota bacterium]
MWLLGALLAFDAVRAQPADPPSADEAPEDPLEPAPPETSDPPEPDPETEPAPEPEAPDPEVMLERAKVLFTNGKRLYDEGAYEAAIEAWETSYGLSQRSGLLFNLSNAYERLGNYSKALELLNRYRAQAELSPEKQEQLSRKASTLEMRAVAAEDAGSGSNRSSGRTAAGATLLVVGGTALVASAVLGGLAYQSRRRVLETCLELDQGFLCPENTPVEIDRAEQFGTISGIALGVAGVGILSGVTLFAAGGKNPQATVEVTWAF